MKSNQSYRTWLIDLSLITILVAVFFSLWLGSHPLLVPDEGRYSEAAREMVVTHDYITPRVNGVAFLDKPILFYWLQASAAKYLGLSEWSMHFWPALFGLLGCLMIYVAGRLLYERRTGLLAAAILASSFLYYLMAHYINLDLEVAVLIDCALFCFIIAAQYLPSKLSNVFFYTAYVFSGLAVLTKGLIGFVFPVMVIGVWVLFLNRWRILRQMHLLAGILIILLINLPWYLLEQHAIPQFFHYFFVKEQYLRFLTANYNNVAPIWFYVPCVLIGLFPWVVFLIQALWKKIQQVWRDKKNYATEFFLLLWPLIVFIFFSIPSSKTVGYITPIFAPLALLIASYLSVQWEQKPSKDILIGVWSFIVLGFGTTIAMVALVIWANRLPTTWHDLHVYFFIFGAIFLLAGMILLWQYRKLTPSRIFFIMLMSAVLTLVTASAGAPHANLTSVKPMVKIIKEQREPGDMVVMYDHYYQDLPFYLQAPVTVVTDWDDPSIPSSDNWQNQLWQGMQFEGKKPWLMSFLDFWPIWYRGDVRIFVLLDTALYQNFLTLSSGMFKVLGFDGQTYLLVNKIPL